jgi:hypothetical protein
MDNNLQWRLDLHNRTTEPKRVQKMTLKGYLKMKPTCYEVGHLVSSLLAHARNK